MNQVTPSKRAVTINPTVEVGEVLSIYDYAPSEIERIDRILSTRYGLAPDAAKALRADAEEAEAAAPDTVRFTRQIKDAVPYEDRTAVIEALWQVVLVDGDRADQENALLRMTAGLLGVSDIDSNAARKRIEASL